MTSLSFAHLREQNLPRCRRWHPAGAPPWSFDDWLLAMGDEVGEALNVVKKLNRDRDGLAGNTGTRDQLVQDLAAELADVVIYLDICVGWDFDRLAFELSDFAALRRDTQAYLSARGPIKPSQLGNALLRAAGDPHGTRAEDRAFWARSVFRTVDALADHFGVDLAAAVIDKFNATSDRFGFPERLVAA